MKRETGENPVRTRHCDKGVAANQSLIVIGKAAVYDDLSARRPALNEAIAATSTWSGKDNWALLCLFLPPCLLGQGGFLIERKITMDQIEFVLPEDIEKRSFEIISQELMEQNIRLIPEQESIIKRVIHTSADFEYTNTLTFSEGAVEIAKELIKNGADIVTDTNMGLAGINKRILGKFGGEAHCFMADPDVVEEAKSRNVTRATVSMERASRIKKPVIFAVGNAPTALIQLHEMIQKNTFRPAFIIGVPVGFVNVVAAKELIINSDIPYIVNKGRKGGSNVAAAICNALLYDLGR